MDEPSGSRLPIYADADDPTISLNQFNGRFALEVTSHKVRHGPFPVPGDIAAFDLPYWVSSIVCSIAPKLTQEKLETYQASVRAAFPSKGQLCTICIGSKTRFHLNNSFHVALPLACERQGSRLTFGAEILGRFTTDPKQTNWTMIVLASAESIARDLGEKLSKPQELLISCDDGVTGIIAFNSERWETSGVDETNVRRIAAERGTQLIKLDSLDASSLAFQTVNQ